MSKQTKLTIEGVLADLGKIGIRARSVDDLKYLSNEHRDAIPILMDYIKKLDNERDKEILVRALSKEGFEGVIPTLLNEFKKNEKDTLYKWAIGNALEAISTKRKKFIEEMQKLVLNKKHGKSRQMIVSALGKSKDEGVVPILIKLLDDEDVVGHALKALTEFRSAKLKHYFESFKDYKVAYIRNIAKKALAQMEKTSKVD